MIQLILVLTLVMQTASTGLPISQKAHRLPLQKRELEFTSPSNYQMRARGYDPKSGEPIEFDPKPQVVLLDAKSGKYAFEWIGYDKQEKTVVFQRADAIDVVVSASVSKTARGRYLYVYKIENLPSSREDLGGFAVQNFASDSRPIELQDLYIGRMSKNQVMSEGDWVRFAPLVRFRPVVAPGVSVEFRLESSAPPDVVRCHVHGRTLDMIGVGEEMPQELANLLPGYKDWPSGYTIGPDEKLKRLSLTERVNQLRKMLPQFRKLGWITDDILQWYESHLRHKELSAVYKHAEQDLKIGKMTTEVHDMIQAIRE